ncbi:MAG TPA: hypothetical protein VMU09_06890 [Acidimicrobiales bacterium]|nr:hypothetical protein [Acidimicrobiales bacterium]
MTTTTTEAGHAPSAVTSAAATSAPAAAATPRRGPRLPADATVLRVEPWPDPVIDTLGHDARSGYVERFWLGVLGPTTTWLLRHIAAAFDESPAGFDLDVEEQARALGLGGRSGRHAPFQRALARCITFELARCTPEGTLGVRRRIPPLPRRHLLRLSPQLQEHHRRWTTAQARTPALEAHRTRARRLALGLREVEPDRDQAEAQLVRWHVHPALACEATTWAWAMEGPRPDERP